MSARSDTGVRNKSRLFWTITPPEGGGGGSIDYYQQGETRMTVMMFEEPTVKQQRTAVITTVDSTHINKRNKPSLPAGGVFLHSNSNMCVIICVSVVGPVFVCLRARPWWYI